MMSTQVLPESYELYGDFRSGRFKKAVWAASLIGLVILLGSYTFFYRLASILRPGFQSIRYLHFEISFERLWSMYKVLVPLVIIIVFHELIHALCLWIYTGKRPVIRATLKGAGGLYVRLPSWYLSRNAFLVVNLAPVCVITLVGSFLILVIEQTGISLLIFCLAVHLAGATGDLLSSVFIFLQPSSVYLTTDGMIYIKGTENMPKWKKTLRSAMKSALDRLE
jgi:hypothetical protein